MSKSTGIRNVYGHTLQLSDRRLTYSKYAFVNRIELKMAFISLRDTGKYRGVPCKWVRAVQGWMIRLEPDGCLTIGCSTFSLNATWRLERWARDAK